MPLPTQWMTQREAAIPEGGDPHYFATFDWATGNILAPAVFDCPRDKIGSASGEDWQQLATACVVEAGYRPLGGWHDNDGWENSTLLLARPARSLGERG